MKRLIRAGLRRVGFDVVRYNSHVRARLLATADVLIDAGAHEGGYARKARRTGFTGRIESFEPIPASFARLRAQSGANWNRHRLALGSRDGTAIIKLCENLEGSSLLELDAEHVGHFAEWRYVGEMEVPLRRLDSLNVVRPGETVFLKLDVEGYELEVLGGAERSLAAVVACELELSLAPVHEGQPSFSELLRFLEERSFRPVWIERILLDRTTGDLLQVDAIFARR